MLRNLRTEKGGFSLLELLVAATVMTLAVLGSLSAHAGSQKLARNARDTERAMSDLQAAMEEVLLSPLDEVTTEFPDGTAMATFDDLHLTDEQVVVSYPNFVGATVPDPLEVVITVTWRGTSAGQRSLTLSTLMTK